MIARTRRVTAIACAALIGFAQLQPALAQAADSARLADGMEATAEALEKIAALAAPADSDPAALAATLDGDAAALTAWVGAHIAHGVYTGMLKGASGALEDRRGNSTDRALLLAALMAARGMNVRLARAMIDADAAARLTAAVAAETYTPSPAFDAAKVQGVLADLAADPRVNGAALTAATQGADAEAAAATAASDALRRKAADGLAAQVGRYLSGPSDRARDLLADHWWVQLETPEGWRDFDPDAAVVGAQTPAETFAPGDVPDAYRHRVVVRFVAEIAGGDGALTATTLLERSYDTAAINGRILTFTAQPVDAAGLDALAASKDDIVADYATGTAWLPLIGLDDTQRQSFVKADGTVLEATDANLQALVGAAGVFGKGASSLDEIGSGEETPPPAGGLFTAAWLEFHIVTPGEAARVETRLIFDAIGPEARESGNYLGDLTEAALFNRAIALRDVWSIVVQGGAVAPARAASYLALNVAQARRAVATWLREGSPEGGPTYPETFRPPALELVAWSLGRNGDAAIAAANIAALRQTARIGANGLEIAELFDIIANPQVMKDAAAHLGAGVADTVFEHQLMAAPEGSINTAVRYAADLDAGIPWSVVVPGDTDALDALRFAPEARALVAADLARGRLVVAKPGAALDDATWWRIDAVTGETLGMTAMGGSEIAEYVIAGSIWVIVFGAAIKLRCDRAGGRAAGQSYAECAGASFGNPFRKAGEDIKKKIGGAIDGALGDPLKF